MSSFAARQVDRWVSREALRDGAHPLPLKLPMAGRFAWTPPVRFLPPAAAVLERRGYRMVVRIIPEAGDLPGAHKLPRYGYLGREFTSQEWVLNANFWNSAERPDKSRRMRK